MKKLFVALAILCAAPAALAQTAVEGIQFTVPTTSAAQACDLNQPCLRLDSSDGHLHWSNVGAGVADGELGATPNPILLPFSDGTYTHALQLGNVLPGVWALIAPGESNPYSSFSIAFKSNADNPDTNNDDVTSIGDNCGPGGGPSISGKTANCLKFENHYEPDPFGNPTFYQSETHLEITDEAGTATRVLSVLGPKLGMPALHVSAGGIAFHVGDDLNAPTALSFDATTTSIHSPAGVNGHLSILLDDNTHQAIVSATDGGGHDAQTIYDGSNGIALTDASNLVRLAVNNNLGLELDTNLARLLDPLDNTTYVTASGGDVDTYVGGVPRFSVRAGTTYTFQTLRPPSPSTVHLGAPGGQFLDAALGGPIESQEGCSSDSRGTLMPVFDPTVDTLQACLGKAGVYSWYTFFTPP